MPAPPRNPSPTHPIVTYPTAKKEDVLLITEHSTILPDYVALEYGAAYNGPEKDKFPGLKLVHQEPSETDRWIRRYWAADRLEQEDYNFSIKYSGGSPSHPIYIRTYLLPQEGYTPIAVGTADPVVAGATLISEEASQTEKMNGYLTVRRAYETLPGPALTGSLMTPDGQLATSITQRVIPTTQAQPGATVVSDTVSPAPEGVGVSVRERVVVPEVFDEKQVTAQKPDVVPEVFRAEIPSQTTVETLAGTSVSMPTLGATELEKSEQRLTKHKKRVSTTTRSTASLPKTVTDTVVNEEGLAVTVNKTLSNAAQTITPSATVSGRIENLGQGLTVKTEEVLPEVFDQKQVTAQKPDVVPEVFRSEIPSETTSETVAGTSVSMPTLGATELEKSEQRVTKHKKRVSTTTRDTASLPAVITDQVVNREGQLVTVNKTLSNTTQTLTPSATVSGKIENLGQGLTVKTEEVLPEVFDDKQVSARRADVIPEIFRAAVPTETTVETLAGTSVSMPTLGEGELEKSEQRVTAHQKRVSTTRRDLDETPVLEGQKTVSEFGGTVATITQEIVNEGTAADQGEDVLDSEVSPLGDGKAVKVTKRRPVDEEEWPTLTETEYVSELDVFVKVEKTVVAKEPGQDGSRTGGGGSDIVLTEYRDIDKWRAYRIVTTVPASVLSIEKTFKKSVQYSIPDEIPAQPVVIKAYSGQPPPKMDNTFIDDIIVDSSVTDAEWDFNVVEGYRGPMVATVTRTVSFDPSEEQEYQWFPSAENKAVAVNLLINQQGNQGARGRIIRFQTPAAIHGAWEVEMAAVFTLTGMKIWEYDEEGALKPGFPVISTVASPHTLTSQNWQIWPVYDREPVVFSCPATVPAAIPHGEEIIVAVNSQPWRAGLWINDVYRVTVP